MSNNITYLKDYAPPDFDIQTTDLTFYLNNNDTDYTRVISRLLITQKDIYKKIPLVLNGHELNLISVKLNQQVCTNYILQTGAETQQLLINLDSVKDLKNFTLEITTDIQPSLNTHLEGLYQVNNLFCTQCEPEGFRRITYYLDRPDVMSVFTVTIIADQQKYPVLLSNGNLTQQYKINDQLHAVTWHDPFKKPCYLFALVAGDLACTEAQFITQSGRVINIQLYTDKGDEDKTAFALQSIQKAMRWDEQVYGREYDLDIFMIVATHSFNMGAMENKGLNIFNSKYILAKPETATDDDYIAIERVIGHEYFHNWTGNRITCRDWFQLSLKEGLTVFRDSQFSADMNAPGIVRINDVNTLRSVQFSQDSGPMAHPVQPKSYQQINNFYTATIYEKGAEIVRMLFVLLGKEKFKKGMECYFSRHDGQAVRIEEFIQAHADANQIDLSQFMEWYHHAGTPVLNIEVAHDVATQTFTLRITQRHDSGTVFYLPFKIGLLAVDSGTEILSQTVNIKNAQETFVFNHIKQKPVLSLLREFSAPVKVHYAYTNQELAFLLTHDTDTFARWDAGQQLTLNIIQDYVTHESLSTDAELLSQAFSHILTNKTADFNSGLVSQLLLLPTEHYLIEQIDCTVSGSLEKLLSARKILRQVLAKNLQELLLLHVHQADNTIAGRSLKNRCLAYLGLLHNHQDIVLQQFYQATNMTDEIAALSIIANHDANSPERQKAFEHFYQKWQHETLVIDKWFALQARSDLPDTLDHIRSLMNHPAFEIKNPNKVRALIGAFTQNLPVFHDVYHHVFQSYQFLTQQIIALNKINPTIAARLCEPLTQFKKHDPQRQTLMKNCLENIKNTANLSSDIDEIVTKSLG